MLKKILLGILSLGLLAGCSSTVQTSSDGSNGSEVPKPDLENKKLPVTQDLVDQISEYYQEISDSLNLYVAEGLVPVLINEEKSFSGLGVYPIYDGYSIIAFALEKDAELQFVTNTHEKLLADVLLIEWNDSLYAYHENEYDLIEGEELTQEEKDKMIRKLSEFNIKTSKLGEGKIRITNHNQEEKDPNVTIVNGVECSPRLLVVTFADNSEDNVKQFEKECKGHLSKTLNQGKMYVFEIDPLYGDDLFVLAKRLERLEFVESVGFSEIAHTTSTDAVQ